MAVSQQTNGDIATEWATLSFAIRQILARTATCTLVKVVSCTNSGGVSPVGTVNVQPVINMVSGDGTTYEYGPLFKLPYSRLQGGTNAVILDPQPGDLGLVSFVSRDISVAKSDAGRAQLQGDARGVPPGSLRQFDISDGVYIGAILNGNPINYVRVAGDIEVKSITKVTIQAPTIELKGAVVQTGGDASFAQAVDVGTTLTASDEVIAGSIHLTTHTHSGVTPGGGTSGPPTP